MKNLEKFAKFLGLKKPIDVTLTTRKPKNWDALYIGKYGRKKLKRHKITISIYASRERETLLMHELIHAWQEENKKREIHGKHFIKLAKKAEKAYKIKDIYIKGVDLN